MELRLTSCIPPSVNHYLGYRAIIKNGKPMGMSYVTQEASKYKHEFTQYVLNEVEAQGWVMSESKSQHYYVDTFFYFDRVDRDCNNYYKVMLDAITDTGIVWPDDNTVCERVQRIYYDTNNPRIELVIHPVEYIGVFDNASQKENFVSSFCVDCTRNTDKCSVLKKAIEGKIQEEFSLDTGCTKFKRLKTKELKESHYE